MTKFLLALLLMGTSAFASPSSQVVVREGVILANPTFIFAGRQTATASAVALPSQIVVNGSVLTALSTNTGSLLVGPCSTLTSLTGYPLAPGQSIAYAVTNLSAICIMDSITTDVLAFTGN